MTIKKRLHDAGFSHRHDPKPGLSYFAYSDFPGLGKEFLSFPNSFGETIRGGLYFNEEKYCHKDKVVVFLHGFGGGHLSYIKEIAYLCEKGYLVASFDAAGCMESEGKSIRGFCQELSDALDLLPYLSKEKDIYLVGHSMGGFSSIFLSDMNPRIKKVVALSPALDVKAVFATFAKSKLLGKWLYDYETSLYPFIKDKDGPSIIASHPEIAYYLIQSKDDAVVPYSSSLGLMEKQGPLPNLTLLPVEGKNHNPNYTASAVKLIGEHLQAMAKCKTDEEKKALADNADWNAIYCLDEEVMASIVSFLEK